MPPQFTFTYSLDEKDYLTHQLYLSSQSERINKKRKRSRYFALALYLAGAAYFLFHGVIIGAVIFAILAVVWYFLAAVWDKKRYFNHYKSYVKETYKERTGLPVTITIDDDYLLAVDSGSESKISLKEITAITEIPALIILSLKGGMSIPFPKHTDSQTNIIINGLTEMARKQNIPYNSNLQWEWR